MTDEPRADLPRTRWDDDPQLAERIEEARREGRLRTIAYSVVVSGVAALAVVRMSEVPQYNSQQDRSRKNCELQQRAIRLTVAVYAEQADNVLGNPAKHTKPFQLKGTPFEKYRPLIVAQARGNRKRAHEYARLSENCKRIFPHKKAIPFVGD